MGDRGLRRGVLLSVLLLAGPLAACESVTSGEIFHQERDVAQVRIGDETVEVASGFDDDSRAGVRAMRIENWTEAAASLGRASAAHPDDWQTHFALGVSLEKLGREAEALAKYERANSLLKGAGKADVTAAVLRLKK